MWETPGVGRAERQLRLHFRFRLARSPASPTSELQRPSGPPRPEPVGRHGGLRFPRGAPGTEGRGALLRVAPSFGPLRFPADPPAPLWPRPPGPRGSRGRAPGSPATESEPREEFGHPSQQEHRGRFARQRPPGGAQPHQSGREGQPCPSKSPGGPGPALLPLEAPVGFSLGMLPRPGGGNSAGQWDSRVPRKARLAAEENLRERVPRAHPWREDRPVCRAGGRLAVEEQVHGASLMGR